MDRPGKLETEEDLQQLLDMTPEDHNRMAAKAMQVHNAEQLRAAQGVYNGTVGALDSYGPMGRRPQVPVAAPGARSFSMTDAEMQYVWAVLPGGSTLKVFLSERAYDYHALVYPGPGAAPWPLPVDVPILRNVEIRVAAHDLTEAELLGALGLIGRLAYGDEAAITLKVTVLAPTPRPPVTCTVPKDGYVITGKTTFWQP